MLENSALPANGSAEPQRRPAKARRRILSGIALLLLLLFAGLGTWQVVRLQWKLALIERVDARVHATPTDVPHSQAWPAISAANDEYRHVRVRGHFLFDLTTPVQAVTVRGSGFWLLTPLCQPDGTTVLVNRGFIPGALGGASGYEVSRAGPDACAAGGESVTVTGLLRLTEPKGGFLRLNDAVTGRWYSRDVAAIAAARNLARVAPFFIDADARQAGTAGPRDAGPPVGGLTVISFPNSHLVYALTWFALAAMVGAAWWWVARRGPGRRHDHAA
ncbi:SURF1 family protein [Massilia sp. S19_KUP03_FR1]|uniref:SURF1 family protein n=1 Tax=Massilia sp. S19_KUP03_FR1 TaxID=3025503 RepID=UPI002FCDC03C